VPARERAHAEPRPDGAQEQRAQLDAETSSDNILTKLRYWVRSGLDTISARARSAAEAGKKKVADRRTARQRDNLLRELGELYYDALSAGRDGPSEQSRDRVIADLDALDFSDADTVTAEADDPDTKSAGA
jgi:hypothetical protein